MLNLFWIASIFDEYFIIAIPFCVSFQTIYSILICLIPLINIINRVSGVVTYYTRMKTFKHFVFILIDFNMSHLNQGFLLSLFSFCVIFLNGANLSTVL